MGKLILKAHEVVLFPVEMSDKAIKKMVKEETGFSVRRLDSFTLISLNAVHRLMAHNNTVENLALYSGAEYMSVDLFQSVITAMANKEAIRPFDFIATVGNAANFYLAKEFNIKGPNIFIGASENILLKNALLAETDITLGHCEQAVIVIWQINEQERRCHALLVEQVKENDNKIIELHDGIMTNDDLFAQDFEGQYPLLINLPCPINR